MEYSGYLDKMETSLGDVVQYSLKLEDDVVSMNRLIGKPFQLTYLQKIRCLGCGKIIPKSYGQGFCFSCLQVSPLASECILNPQKCKAHLGVSRSMEWSEGHCLMPHIVYLAWSSHVKVGVTRLTQIPTRWIDQGALAAIKVAQLPNRHIAGITEVFLMKYFSDKTAWQQMLTCKFIPGDLDLISEKAKAIGSLPSELKKFVLDDNSVMSINYPMPEYPTTLLSIGFDKQKTIQGILTGIKGQYLIVDNSMAFNVRKHTGYAVMLSF